MSEQAAVVISTGIFLGLVVGGLIISIGLSAIADAVKRELSMSLRNGKW